MNDLPKKSTRVILLASLAGLFGAAHAQVIVGATSVSSANAPLDPRYPLTHLIDQSGFATPYVSGVTDFSSFVASARGYSSMAPGTPLAQIGVVDGDYGTITFDFGSAMTLDKIAIWNDGNMQSLKSFELFANGQALGAYTVDWTSGITAPANVFSFAPTTASSIELKIDSTYGDTFVTEIDEVAFEAVTPVPEPESYALISAGLALMAGLARRRTGSMRTDR